MSKSKEPKVKQRKALEMSSGDVGSQPQESVESFTNPTDSIITKFQEYCDATAEWDVTIIRAYTSRIYSRVYDKGIKIKHLEYLRSSDKIFQLLVNIMKSTEDKIILANVGGILLHATIIRVGLNRLPALKKAIEAGLTEVILEKVSTSNDPSKCSIEMFCEYLMITEEISERDPAFVEKTLKIPNCIASIHFGLQNFFLTRPSLMRPLIVIISKFSSNENAMIVLLNDGFILTIQNLMDAVGTKISLRLKRILQGISKLSRSTAFTCRMLSSNILPCCVKIISKWYKLQGKIGSTCLKYLSEIIQNTIAVENGVETLRVLGVDNILQKICNRFPRTRTYDLLLPKFVSILLAIRGKTDLPVDTYECPFRFNLPKIKKLDESDGDSSDSDDGSDKEDEDNQGSAKTIDSLTKSPVLTPSTTQIDLSHYGDLWAELTTKKFPFASDQSKLLENLDSEVIQSMYNSLSPQKPKKDRGITALITPGYLNDIRSAYIDIHSRINNLVPFVKLAFPDLNYNDLHVLPEPLAVVGKKKFRAKLLTTVKQSSGTLRAGFGMPVYDLDKLIASYPNNFKIQGNNDAARVGVQGAGTSLMFESRFESGNLRKAYQVSGFEYDLVLCPDVNSKRHMNWFYFEVSNMTAKDNYTFNIVNCERCKSQFSFGMKPVMYSVRDYTLGKPGWKRIGSEIHYYKNSYFRPPGKDNKRRTYYTASFTVKFPHSYDVCYIAYHYPYTYTNLLAHLWEWQRLANSEVFRVEKLCYTMNGNEVPLVTITSPNSEENPVKKRELVFITGRIHPGESNSSWVMQGLIDSLLLPEQPFEDLRNKFVFKIIPMLNIEGVVHGCSRCGLSDEDLNRRWRNPDPMLHPSVYHAKGLIQFAKSVLRKNPYLYCDFHGHTTSKNVFLYGCCPNSLKDKQDKPEGDLETDNEREKELVGKLARVMKECSDVFSISSCRYNVAKLRESTARVTIWRELGVQRSYTMETSFCGSDTGPNKGHHLGLEHLLGIGKSFCLALGRLDKASITPSKITLDHKASVASSLPPDEGSMRSNYERGVLLSDADQ